ncbi:hypothetical protein IAU59_007123 [Kwoniella sp. CBS 9459]
MRLLMLFTAQAFAALVSLATCMSAVVGPVRDTESIVKRDDGPGKSVLVPEGGPTIYDVFQNKIGSTWFTSILGAMAYKDSATITNLWKDTGAGKGEYGAETDKADFCIYAVDGTRWTIEKKWDDLKAGHDYKTGKHWYIAGSESAAEDVNGYLGTDHEKLSAGSPVDAYHMLTGQKALMKQVPNAETFFELLQDVKSDKANKPMVFQVGDVGRNALGLYRRNWYAVLDMDDSTPAINGEKPWEVSQIKYYRAKEESIQAGPLADIAQYVVQVVFPDQWPPPDKE